MLFKNPAEISLVVISTHFSDLFDRQPWFVKKQPLGMAHTQVDQIFGWRTVVDLTENFCQVAGTVVHIISDQVQIDVLTVIFYNEILEQGCNLWWR